MYHIQILKEYTHYYSSFCSLLCYTRPHRFCVFFLGSEGKFRTKHSLGKTLHSGSKANADVLLRTGLDPLSFFHKIFPQQSLRNDESEAKKMRKREESRKIGLCKILKLQSVCCFHFSKMREFFCFFFVKNSENFPVTHLEMFFCFLAAVCHIITGETRRDFL